VHLKQQSGNGKTKKSGQNSVKNCPKKALKLKLLRLFGKATSSEYDNVRQSRFFVEALFLDGF